MRSVSICEECQSAIVSVSVIVSVSDSMFLSSHHNLKLSNQCVKIGPNRVRAVFAAAGTSTRAPRCSGASFTVSGWEMKIEINVNKYG